ncbi:5-bromo-4-chloroindolyl phosphate hydrolysis family protein [Caulobacter sp. LARHSG274]
MGRGAATLLAAVAAAVTLPLLALGLSLPWWLALALALAVFGGVWLVLKPSGDPGPGLTDEAVLDARSATAQGLLLEATTAMDRLRKVRREIQDPPMRAEIAHLLEVGDKVVREVREDPSRAMAVRRLLTFYLPNAASVADGWRTLEARSVPSTARMTQTREVMGGLSQAFAKYADDVAEPELQTLDLDLKVLKDALKADLSNTP